MWRKRHLTNQSWLAAFGRLLMIVSLWQAPLPIVHAHGTDLADSADEAAFVEHLSTFHSDVKPNSHVDFGWHWHLVPPAENHPGDDGSDGHGHSCPCGHHDDVLMTQTSGISSNIVVVDSHSDWIANVLPVTGGLRAVSPHTPSTFLETYLGSVSLGTLLRVARC